MMQLHKVDAGGITVEIADAGSGSARRILLIHGFTGAKEDFAETVDRLADIGWHAVAPDLRGHGNSTKPASEDDYDFERFADDLWALVDALGWDRFVLLGHSMGGMISQVAALRDPSRLTGLVLMDTTHGPLEGIDTSELELGASIVREHGMETLLELMNEREGVLETPAAARVRGERPGWEEFERRKFLSSSPAMWAAMTAKMASQAERLDALSTLSLPVLVIVGEQDRPFVAASERMAKTIPGARLVVIPDAGHSPQFENTEPWWNALASFLEEVG
ncbi:MAG: alpha/beta hydrolase [Acidimicrobiia bacterium]|nr:alpha/beta hydrolase [Acidimicrobiia bacterium]